MEENKDKCDVCGLTQFTVREGYYYCDECGAQSQNVRDLVIDQEDIEATQGFFTSIKISKEKTDKAQLTTWECFNYMLRCTVDELQNLGAKEELKFVTLQIWTTYLRKIEVAFFNKKSVQLPRLGPKYFQRDARLIYNHTKPKRKKSETSQASGKIKLSKQKKIHAKAEYETMSQATSLSEQSLTGSSTTGGSVQAVVPVELSRSARTYYKRLMPAQHLKKHETDSKYELTCHSLRLGPRLRREMETLSRRTMQSIIYLALNQCQDDFQLCDLLRYYREGHLPNMKYAHLLPEDIAKNCEQVVNMQEHGKWEFYRSSAIRESAAYLAKFLHIPEMVLPDLLKLSKRFITDLNLPPKLGSYIERLYNFHPPKMTFKFTNVYTPSYEGRAMAYIIFMLKLIFVLDGEAEQVISNSAKTINLELKSLGDLERSVFVWEDWVQYIEMRKVILTLCHPPTSIHFGENANYDEYIEHTTKFYETTDDKVGKTNRIKLMMMAKIFEDLRVKLMNKEHKERIPSLKCPPSLTPYSSYLRYILNDQTLADKIIIPDFMRDDPSKKDIEPLVDCMELKKVFKENNIQLITKKVTCKSLREYLGIYKCYHDKEKRRISTSIRLRKVDFDIDDDEWLESLGCWQPSNVFTQTHTASKGPKRRKEFPIAPTILRELITTREKNRIQTDAASVCSFNLLREDNMEPATSDIIGEAPRLIENENLFEYLDENDEMDDDSQEEINNTSMKIIELKVSSFDCWNLLGVKRYMLTQDIEQVEKKLPKTFHWLLKTCAEIVEMEVMDLYEEVLAIENEFIYALNPIDNVGDTLSFNSNNYERDMQHVINYYKNVW